jgi:hypothetical protein
MNRDQGRRITLFSNLSYVTIGDVRTNCGALILEPRDPQDRHPGGFFASRDKIRGFAYGASNPCFDMFPPSLEYVAQDADSSATLVMLRDGEDKPIPMFRGAILTFKDGPVLRLMAGTHDDRPIQIDHIESPDHGELYDTLWATMDRRIAEFCDTPNQLVVVPRVNFGYETRRRQRGG